MKQLDEIMMMQRIEALSKAYTAVPSHTNTSMEKDVEAFFQSWFESVPYFRMHTEKRGFHRIPGDYLERSVPWALVKGSGTKTVVLIHHSDTADILDFGTFSSIAYDMDAATEGIKTVILQGNLEVSEDRRRDALSGEWIYGRGLCDMKGGGAVEMALMEHYSAQPDFEGNLLLIAVPDEENLSAGMRGAIPLLSELKVRFGLDYTLLINTEPHDRETPDRATLYQGSVGKIMPVVYCKGKAAHVSQVFNGLNPNMLMAEIVRRTEMNPAYMESNGQESTLPPVWLYLKDRKQGYDVSLPLATAGYLSILTFEKSPMEYMDMLKSECNEAFKVVIESLNRCYDAYVRNSGSAYEPLPLEPKVFQFDELISLAQKRNGEQFAEKYRQKQLELKTGLAEGCMDMAEASIQLIELGLEHAGITEPAVVIALSPPYYPSVNNDLQTAGLMGVLEEYGKQQWNQEYAVKDYFFGISDISYAIYNFDSETMARTRDNMPLWGDLYSIPLDAIQELSIPAINIGPWGKDFHKITERVYREDLYYRTPALVDQAIRWAVKGKCCR